MRNAARAGLVILLALAGSVVLCVMPSSTMAVTLAATAALIMGGSGIGNHRLCPATARSSRSAT